MKCAPPFNFYRQRIIHEIQISNALMHYHMTVVGLSIWREVIAVLLGIQKVSNLTLRCAFSSQNQIKPIGLNLWNSHTKNDLKGYYFKHTEAGRLECQHHQRQNGNPHHPDHLAVVNHMRRVQRICQIHLYCPCPVNPPNSVNWGKQINLIILKLVKCPFNW